MQAMRWRPGRGRLAPLSCLLLLAAGAGLSPEPALATILLFDEERDAVSQTTVGPTTSGGRLPADYGDNVTGLAVAVPGGTFTYGDGGEGFTPNVTVDISAAGSTPADPRAKLWQTGYGDLVNVVFAEGPGTEGSPQLDIVLTAEPGYAVDLYGFDLAGFASTDYTIAGVQVLAGAMTLFEAVDVLVEGDLSGPRHTSFVFTTPLSAPEILLRVDMSNLAASIQDNIGIDSIRFGQTPPSVPEPGTAALLLGGLAWLAIRSARSRNRLPLPGAVPRRH